uniref:Uncharacterized protein n=1 Tax=Cacopsylla melanoneura TaxID=428564 RepID=A0A8D9FGS1_9HEMI
MRVCDTNPNYKNTTRQYKNNNQNYEDRDKYQTSGKINNACVEACKDRVRRDDQENCEVNIPTESLHCHYPTEERMIRPLITYSGITEIRYTTDPKKAAFESGLGIEYRLITVKPTVEAPWCKRNGIQDYWREDPKYSRQSMDIYSTPYPCCDYTREPIRVAQPCRPTFQNSVERKGWECCGGTTTNMGPRGPPRNGLGCAEMVVQDPRINRARDLVPQEPRHFDRNGQC